MWSRSKSELHERLDQMHMDAYWLLAGILHGLHRTEGQVPFVRPKARGQKQSQVTRPSECAPVGGSRKRQREAPFQLVLEELASFKNKTRRQSRQPTGPRVRPRGREAECGPGSRSCPAPPKGRGVVVVRGRQGSARSLPQPTPYEEEGRRGRRGGQRRCERS